MILMGPIYPIKSLKEEKIPEQRVKVLKPVNKISAIESGMNRATDTEKNKHKISKGIAPFL